MSDYLTREDLEEEIRRKVHDFEGDSALIRDISAPSIEKFSMEGFDLKLLFSFYGKARDLKTLLRLYNAKFDDSDLRDAEEYVTESINDAGRALEGILELRIDSFNSIQNLNNNF